MSELPDILLANDRYAASRGELPARPRRHLAILACMDVRFDPARALGLVEGEAHVIRNAGGRASDDALRSLIISCTVLGTREVLVISHTDCGMLALTEAELRERVGQERGVDASGLRFLTFSDLDATVRADIAAIQASPYIPRDIRVYGFVYDVQSSRLRSVDAPPDADG